MSSLKGFLRLLRDAASRWSDDQCYRFGASLSYYAVFSIFPLLLLCTTAVGFMMGHDATLRDRLLGYLEKSSPSELRPLLEETLTSMQTHTRERGIGAVVGVVTLMFGASGVFSELGATLNIVWRVPGPKTRSFRGLAIEVVKDKALAFLVVLAAALTAFCSLLASAAVRGVDGTATPAVSSPGLWLLVETVVSFALLTPLFGAMFKLIPRATVAWRDVLGGAAMAAALFTGLKHLLTWYLGHVGSYAAYGAVGGILGLLTWIYVASLILFFGAEFTRVYAERYGSLLVASPGRHGPSGTVSASEPCVETSASDAMDAPT